MEETEIRSDRARIHESCRDVYTALTTGNNPTQAPFFSLKDVFMFAACVGYRAGRRKKLPSGKKDTIRMEVFSEKERDILKGIALADSNDIHVLEKKPEELISSKVLSIVEEYAHGGIEDLRAALIEKPGLTLWNLIDLVKS